MKNLKIILCCIILFSFIACEPPGSNESSAVVIPPSETVDQQQLSEQLSDPLAEFVIGLSSQFENDEKEDELNPDEFRSELPDVLALVLANQTNPAANEFLFVPDPRVCSDYIARNNPAACIEGMGNVSIRLIQSEKSNEFRFFFNNFNPFTLVLSDTSLTATVNLTDAVATFRAINEIIGRYEPAEKVAEADIPTLTGSAQVALNKQSEELSVSLSLLSDIYLKFMDEDGEVEINLDQTSNLISAVINNTNQTMDVNLNLASFLGEFPIWDDSAEVRVLRRAKLEVGSFAGNINFNSAIKEIQFTNFGFVNSDFARLSVQDNKVAEVSFYNTNFTLKQVNNFTLFKANSDLTLNASFFASQFFQNSGSLNLQITNNTLIQINEYYEGDNQDPTTIFKQLNGALSLNGSGDLLGALLAGVGDCYTEVDTEDFVFPLEKVSCTNYTN